MEAEEQRGVTRKRRFLFRNGGKPGEGRVLNTESTLSWEEFLANVAKKLVPSNNQDSKETAAPVKVWLASNGAQIESVEEFADGETLCVAYDREELFDPSPLSA